jgi:hypothetical protein
MLNNEKAARVLQNPAALGSTSSDPNYIPKKPRAKSKDEAMLRAFHEAGEAGINAPEAAYRNHDLCLHSTASRFAKVYGIVLCRKSETFGRFGSICSRYWLSEADRLRVAAMLGEVTA